MEFAMEVMEAGSSLDAHQAEEHVEHVERDVPVVQEVQQVQEEQRAEPAQEEQPHPSQEEHHQAPPAAAAVRQGAGDVPEEQQTLQQVLRQKLEVLEQQLRENEQHLQDGPHATRAPPFMREEDELLISQGCLYEVLLRLQGKPERLSFWKGVREIFAQHGFPPRGPADFAQEDLSPYRRRWQNIRSSYRRVKNIVIGAQPAVPIPEADLAQLVEETETHQMKYGTLAGLTLGFRHFCYIYQNLDVPLAAATSKGSKLMKSSKNPDSNKITNATASSKTANTTNASNSSNSSAHTQTSTRAPHEGSTLTVRAYQTPPASSSDATAMEQPSNVIISSSSASSSTAAAPPHTPALRTIAPRPTLVAPTATADTVEMNGTASRKRSIAEVSDMLEGAFHRVRRVETTTTRFANGVTDLCKQMEDLTAAMEELKSQTNSTVFKADVLAKLAMAMNDCTDDSTRTRLQWVFDIVYADTFEQYTRPQSS